MGQLAWVIWTLLRPLTRLLERNGNPPPLARTVIIDHFMQNLESAKPGGKLLVLEIKG